MSSVDDRIAELEAAIYDSSSEQAQRSAELAQTRATNYEQRAELTRLRREQEQIARAEWVEQEGYDYVSSTTEKYILGVNITSDRVIISTIEWNQVTGEVALDADQLTALLEALQV